MVIPTVPRESLLMQDLVGGDNNRTPVKFQGSDNLVFVGDSTGVMSDPTTAISCING
jgi:hypothetical protein